MNREQRMRKRWLPKEKKQETDEGIVNWYKAKFVIIGFVIAIIILIVIFLKW